MLLLVSCNKDDEIIDDSNTSNVNIYENNPNTTDAMIANVYQPENQTNVYFYGAFNNNGVPKSINSIKVKRTVSDTLHSYILDENKRIKIVYSELNGQKLEKVLKLDYLPNNKVSINIYNYNWTNNTDILIKQYLSDFNTNTLTTTYGRTMNTDEIEEVNNSLGLSKNELIKLYNFGVAVAGVAATLGACVGPQGMTPICPYATLAIWTAVGILTNQIAKGDELKGFSPNFPTSPNSQQMPIPTGTPQNPSGYSNLIIGNWKKISDIVCGVELYSIPIGQTVPVPSSCGGSGVFVSIPTCEKDNIWTFNLNMTTTFTEGLTSCNPPIIRTGSYSLNGNTLNWGWQGGFGSSAEILQLDSQILKLKSSATEIFTLQRQ